MKTNYLKILSFILSVLLMSACTNPTDKPNVILTSEEIIQTTSPSLQAVTDSNISNTTWHLRKLNNEDVCMYETISIPYIIFSYDSLFILGNSGCNDFIGECIIQNNNTIDIYNIKNKEQYYPANALERELIYSLDISDYYWIENDTLILYHQNTPVGIFVAK